MSLEGLSITWDLVAPVLGEIMTELCLAIASNFLRVFESNFVGVTMTLSLILSGLVHRIL